jgi:hypothetical protein
VVDLNDFSGDLPSRFAWYAFLFLVKWFVAGNISGFFWCRGGALAMLFGYGATSYVRAANENLCPERRFADWL